MNIKKELRVIHYVYGPTIGLFYMMLLGGVVELWVGLDTGIELFTYAGVVFLCIAFIQLCAILYQHISTNLRISKRVWWYQ